MQTIWDNFCTMAIAAVMAGLSVSAFSHTDAGDPSSGWSNGNYQRSYEDRFETSVPAHAGSIALWASAKWALFQEPAKGAVAGKEGWLFTSEEFSEPAATRDLAAELVRISGMLSDDGIELLPLIIPDKARMHVHRLSRGRSDGFSGRYDRALQAIEHAGIVAVDLREALGFDSSFMRTDTHWSPEGARRVAETTAKTLRGLSVVETTVQTTATGTARFEGDLLSFVPTGQFRARLGPAPEFIETFETQVAAPGGLFGDATVPVALVGTSYSAKPEFHFEGFLKQALRADVLNASAVGQGPFAPMDAFLTDRASLSSFPSVVVWEIPERFLTSRRQKP